MNATRISGLLLLVLAACFTCAARGQAVPAQELEAYRLNLNEQVGAGKLTTEEAAALYGRKQNQSGGQAGAGNAGADQPPRGTGKPALYCQTYPDGRTECR